MVDNPTTQQPPAVAKDPFADAWARVQGILTRVNRDIAGVVKVTKQMLGWADQELPNVDKTLQLTAGVMAAFFPQAAVAESAITAIRDGIAFAEKLVKGADGVVTTVDQAVGATEPASGPEKNAAMNQFVDNAGFEAIPNAVINMLAEPHVVALQAAQKLQPASASS